MGGLFCYKLFLIKLSSRLYPMVSTIPTWRLPYLHPMADLELHKHPQVTFMICIRPDLETLSPTGETSLVASAHQIAVLRLILSLPQALPSGYEHHPSVLSDDWLLRAFLGHTVSIIVVPLATKVRRLSGQISFWGI